MNESRGTEEFQNYLSAFLSAARAVTWVLDKEYKNSEYAGDFVDWYGDTSKDDGEFREGTKAREMQKDELFQLMATQRNFVLKEGHSDPNSMDPDVTLVSTSSSSKVSLPSPTQPDGPIEIRFIMSGDTEAEPRYYFTNSETQSLPEDFKTKSICSLSETYLSKLNSIIEEWGEIVTNS